MDPSARCLPARSLFAPSRACDIASDALCRGPRRKEHRCPIPFAPSRQIRLPSPSRQRRRSRRTRTPSIVRVLPPPVAPALSRLRVGSRGTRHRSRLLASWRLSPPRSGFRRLFTRVTRAPLGVRAIELDPWSCDRGPSAARRLLQPNTTREHHRGDRPTPAFRRADHALRALSRPSGLSGVRQVSGSSARRRVKPKPHASADGCQPRVHGPGAIRLSTIRGRACEPA